ncbi:MAG: integrase [Burkholderiaceae bacterium]
MSNQATNAAATATSSQTARTHGTRAGVITAREIDAASGKAKVAGKDVWLTDPGARGQGRFTIRCTASGARVCMYRYTRSDGKCDIVKVADYDPRGITGLNLHEARAKAGEMARLAGVSGNLRAALNALDEAKAAAIQAADAQRRKVERGSLAALFQVYVATLQGRQSHYDAQSIFKLHVVGPFPSLAARPAAQVSAEEMRDVLARLIDAGKGRTAAKLRAYLRAAYGMAMRAALDPTLPEALTAFDVQTNPADRLPSLAQFSRALDRTLSLPELRAFWRRVSALSDSPARDSLIACMYLGGQRPTQLLRVTPSMVDVAGATMTLLDPKGRNRHANPRRHVLPIHDDLLPVIQRRLAQARSFEAPLFSTNGRVTLRKETVAAIVEEIEKAMAAAGELERGPFSLRDLRRTAETHMAALGISRDLRAQIQSHGLGGIQARHYDRHGYMPEKRRALMLWAQRFTGSRGSTKGPHLPSGHHPDSMRPTLLRRPRVRSSVRSGSGAAALSSG